MNNFGVRRYVARAGLILRMDLMREVLSHPELAVASRTRNVLRVFGRLPILGTLLALGLPVSSLILTKCRLSLAC